MIGRVLRVARTPLTLLILLGILCYGAWWGWTNVLKPFPAAPAAPCVDQRVRQGALHTNQVSVNVFNGGDRQGLAGDVARVLRQRGFKVLRATNTGERIQSTVIVGAGAENPEVLLVRSFFRKASIRVDHRPDRSVDVLVGSKFAGYHKKARSTYPVPSPSICLPSQAQTSPPSDR